MKQHDHEDDGDRRIWPTRDEWRQFGRDMRDVGRGTYEPSPWVREQTREIERDAQQPHPLEPHSTEQREGVWWRNDEEAER